MVLFLTSSFIEYRPIDDPGPVHIRDDYEFIPNLKKYWRGHSGILVIAADPDDTKTNDIYAQRIEGAFKMAGFDVRSVSVLDGRSSENAFDLIKNSDVIVISGGHAPTQNTFFEKIGLKYMIQGYPGIVISLSAGSVNCAAEAYTFPEKEGEAADPGFIRFREGLGLTDISIIPHYSYLRGCTVDGKNIIDDIVYPNSLGRKFYVIDDGSYFLIDGDVTKLFGKAECLQNGAFQVVDSYVSENDWNAVMTGAYICVFEIDARTDKTTCKFTSDFLGKYDVSVTQSETFCEFIREFAAKIVVEKERESVLNEITPEGIRAEIDEMGNFSRTVHSEKGGIRRAIDVRIRRFEHPTDNATDICIIQDITEMIDRDWMTDILSRTGFIGDVEKKIKDLNLNKGYSIIYTNIRGFKTINDLFGEETGDLVIFQVRDHIRDILEPMVLGRLDSDHFVALVSDDHIKRSRMKKLVQMTYRGENKQYDFSVSCGIYHITDSGLSVGIMIDRAKLAESNLTDSDTALFAEYTDKMRSDYVNQMLLISDVGEAVRQKELMSFYQPIVDTKTGKIVSAESLVRWNHHDLGMVSPGLFIPALEQSGKVSSVDLYMAETVFGMIRDSAKAGAPVVPVSINLSRVDFYDPGFLDRIKELLDDPDFPVGLVKLEITESAYAILEKNALDFLNSVQEKKVKILLDDYGSGMSSLSTLESYEFDTIKLDLGFIHKIGQSAKAETIIRSTISMAHAFGADVIAEGVENGQQLSFLKDADCDMIQGYYFYKPMPERDFAGLLRDPEKTDPMLPAKKGK